MLASIYVNTVHNANMTDSEKLDTTVGVRLTSANKDKLNAIADRRRQRPSTLLTEVVTDWIDQHWEGDGGIDPSGNAPSNETLEELILQIYQAKISPEIKSEIDLAIAPIQGTVSNLSNSLDSVISDVHNVNTKVSTLASQESLISLNQRVEDLNESTRLALSLADAQIDELQNRVIQVEGVGDCSEPEAIDVVALPALPEGGVVEAIADIEVVLTRKELAGRLKVTHQTIGDWDKDGKLLQKGWERVPGSGPSRYRPLAHKD